MNQAQFIIQTKNWLYHKFLLADKSKAFKDDRLKKSAMFHIKGKFEHFVKFPKNYSVGQLALLVKRNEALLESVLPIPSNPSYENSLAMLTSLVKEAEQIINHLHLTI